MNAAVGHLHKVDAALRADLLAGSVVGGYRVDVGVVVVVDGGDAHGATVANDELLTVGKR